MKKYLFGSLIFAIFTQTIYCEEFRISKDELKDKIKGGWAGQTIGCTFGGPTEFRYQGTMVMDYVPIKWYDGYIKWWYDNAPGLYDDIYMDLTFVEVFEEEGLDAPAESFAKAFAHADYSLWHANQCARYNILNGIMPPESGHWLNNPHADDIDYQIESDFAGLMCPGMVNTSAEISDKIGHIMNYGDGWYGGVYLGALYSLAFISDDMQDIVKEALKTIPKQANYYKVIDEAIRAYDENPNDWKYAWYKVQANWANDVGSPDGVFTPFNIDATVNSAWVVIGLLYGEKDFGKTVSISTRCGDDSDCNPASAGGILGAMIGYSNIPAYWKMGLAEVEPIDFKYTDISLNDVYAMGYKHAVENIKKNGGSEDGDDLVIQTQAPKPVRYEKCFENHFPTERMQLNKNFNDETEFEFTGVGFSTTGGANKKSGDDYVFEVELYIDDKLVETSKMPTNFVQRKYAPFWRYQLRNGDHKVRIKVLNPTENASIHIGDLIIYSDKPSPPKY